MVDIVISRYNEDLLWLQKIDLEFIDRIFIYNKGDKPIKPDQIVGPDFNKRAIFVESLPNVGREAHTYLYHIINHWEDLATTTIFLPGSADSQVKWQKAYKTIQKAIETKQSVFLTEPTKDLLKDHYNFTIRRHASTYSQNAQLNPESKLEPSPDRPFGKWLEKNVSPHFQLSGVMYFGIFAASKEDITQYHSLDYYKYLIKYVDHHTNPEAGHYFERAWQAIFTIPPPDDLQLPVPSATQENNDIPKI